MQTTRNVNVAAAAAAAAAPPLSSSSSSSTLQQQQQQQGSSSSSSSLTVYQITAVAYVYNRIAKVLLLGPMAIVGMYMFTAMSLLLLDKMTHGLAHVAIVMTLVLAFSGFQTIRLLLLTTADTDLDSSKTSSRLDKALRANEIRLPILSLILSVTAARFVVQPLIQFALGDSNDMTSTSLSSIFITWTSLKSLLRITCIVALLSISVFARYIGRQSIMRMSCAPLAVNYLEYWIRFVWNYSLVGDVPGQLLAVPNKALHRGRRFQRPTLLATVSQFIIGLVIGGAIAYLVDLDWFATDWQRVRRHHGRHDGNTHEDDNDCRRQELFFTVLAASLLTTTSHYHLHNISHELSPFRYTTMMKPFDLLDQFFGHDGQKLLLQSLVKNLVYSIVISVISMTGSVYFSSFLDTKSTTTMVTGGADNNNMAMNICLMCALSFCTLLMQICLSFVDESIKYALFRSSRTTTNQSVDNTIVLLSQDSPTEYLNTLLASLLMDNPSLVTGVLEAASESEQQLQQHHAYVVDDFGEQYMQKMFQLVKGMGNVLIARLQPDVVEAFLEEDVFRFAILESLGGEGGTRRNGVIAEWASKGTCIGGRPGGQGRQEPLIVVLVRGLCVFLGGMSQAIGVCFDKPQKNMRTVVESFELPAGVFACTNFALAALARCFAECFEERRTTPAKNADPGPSNKSWKSDHLKILIPIAINILYDLRCQIVRADAATDDESDNTTNVNTHPLYRHRARPTKSPHESRGSSTTSTTTSDLKQLLAACEVAATHILHTTTAMRQKSSSSSSSPTAAMEFDHHVHNMPLLHPDAGRWLKDCNDSSLSSGVKLD